MNTTLHIYTRVSSQIQQDEGTSLDSQRVLGIKRAAELGFDHRLWNEGGQSSSSDDLLNRPVLVNLLTQIESGSIKHLFVYNTDRLSRNQQTWAVIRYKLLSHGVTLHTASGQLKLNNPVDDLMLGILSEISQYDNKIRSERSRIGRFNKVQQGGWKGGPPPFGYRLVDRRLEIDPFESEWVRKMYELSCSGKSSKSIQTFLHEQGVVTRRGHKHWSIGSIDVILKNSVYIGYYNYTDKLIGETVRITTPVIVENWMSDRIKHQRQLNRGVNRTNPKKHFYLLRGLLVCGHCGRPLGGRITRDACQNIYYCVSSERSWVKRDEDASKWQRGSSCSFTRSINIELTDRIITELIHSALTKLDRSQHQDAGYDVSTIERYSEVNRILSDDLTNISLNDIELQNRIYLRQSITTLVQRITVEYDGSRNRHRLAVRFNENVSRELRSSAIDRIETTDYSWSLVAGDCSRSDNGEGRCQNAADQGQSEYRHGGIGQSVSSTQKTDLVSAETITARSQWLKLSVRKLSPYQQELIDTINRLRCDRWNDKQIADHFNQTGKLTPRGHRWFPQSVASIRKKLLSRGNS